MEEENKKIDDILEILNFLKDNSVTKDEFQEHVNEFQEHVGEFKEHVNEFKEHVGEFDNFREQQKEEFRKVRSEIIDHIDGFIGLHKHLEVELAAVNNKTNRLENHINMIAKHLQLELP